MAFNLENLSIVTNSVKAGAVPAVWLYYNEGNDVVTATSFFAVRGRFTVGDIILVMRADNRVPEAYRVSALATDSEYATAIRIANSYVNAQTPETKTAASNLYDTLSLVHDLSLLVTTAASIDVVYTADITTNYITVASGTLTDNMIVQVSTSDTQPGGLSLTTDYYTRDTNAAGTACKLSASLGGAAIDITAGAVGVQTLEVTENAFVLPDGVEGQRKLIKLKTDGTLDARIIPANLQDGTTIVFGTANEYVSLVFAGAKWNVIETPGGTIA